MLAINEVIEQRIKQLEAEAAKEMSVVRELAIRVSSLGGSVYFVGGLVRDMFLFPLEKHCHKDIDIEVHGVEGKSLESILEELGEVTYYGESFGVYGLKGYGIDIALPRTEKLTSSAREVMAREGTPPAHRDFEVSVDPKMGTMAAARRRDFTVNAMMVDVLSHELVDHYGGLRDIAERVIRHVDEETFVDDPLRVLRGAQFASRFGFTVVDETIQLFARMDLSNLARERVYEEVKKALLLGERPSVFFEVLRKADNLEFWFPEVAALIGVEQPPKYHSEGDVWNHTMLVLDKAAARRDSGAVSDKALLMWSALCHDLGKVNTTTNVDGVIHAYGHENSGIPIAGDLLGRLTNERRLISNVQNIIKTHMRPNVLAAQNSSVKATNKLFDEACDADVLLAIAASDREGSLLSDEAKGAASGVDYEVFLSARLAVYRERMAMPHVTGLDLLAAGVLPGKKCGELLKYAHSLRLAGVPYEEALERVLGRVNKKDGEERDGNRDSNRDGNHDGNCSDNRDGNRDGNRK